MPSSAEKRRQDKLMDRWPRSAGTESLGDERMRFILVRDGKDSEIGKDLTAVRWDDISMEPTGEVQAQGRRFRDGDRLRLEFSPSSSASFRQIGMFAADAESGFTWSLEAKEGSATLASGLARYRQTQMDFSYRKDKAHPRGWTCDQVAVDVGRRTKLPLGKIAGGTHRITNLVRRDADPVDVILVAYQQEREATGQQFFGAWDGKLNMTPLRYSATLLDISPAIMSAALTERRRPDFATVLDVKVSVKSGTRKTRKVHVTVSLNVAKYGRVTKQVSPKGISSEAEARRWALGSLRRRQSPRREFEVSVPLMPMVRRGDAILVKRPEDGVNQVMFVRAASHDWSPGSGSTSLTMRFDDPFESARRERVAAKKKAAAAQNGRAAPKGATKAKAKTRKDDA